MEMSNKSIIDHIIFVVHIITKTSQPALNLFLFTPEEPLKSFKVLENNC